MVSSLNVTKGAKNKASELEASKLSVITEIGFRLAMHFTHAFFLATCHWNHGQMLSSSSS